MDPEVLERLATDRSFGALAGDVEHLLDAYLRLDPHSAATACEIGRAVELTRRALCEKPTESMPAFPVEGFRQIERWRRRVRRFTYAAGLAACMAIGMGLGRVSVPASASDSLESNDGSAMMASTGTVTRPIDAHQTVSHSALVRPVPVRSWSQRADAGFWSVERLREQREQDRLRTPPPQFDKVVRKLLAVSS